MAIPKSAAGGEVPVPIPPKSHKWKLGSCCIVISILCVANITLTTLSLLAYYDEIVQHWDCAQCFFRSYLIVAIAVASLSIPLLIAAIPLAVLRTAYGIRIYVTILFLATFLRMMVGILLKQKYQLISDVISMWRTDKSLTYFEVKYECCGVLGPEDYLIDGRDPPLSCYKYHSFMPEDLYTKGCSTLYVQHDPGPHMLLYSLICQICMVLALVIYMIILKRTIPVLRTSSRA